MSLRGFVRTLSSNEAASVLGLVCYKILTRRASVEFPLTTVTSPSPFVRVTGLGGVLVDVSGTQWSGAVAPVLLSDQFSPLNLATWSLPEDQVVRLLSDAIGLSFESAGYGPYLPG